MNQTGRFKNKDTPVILGLIALFGLVTTLGILASTVLQGQGPEYVAVGGISTVNDDDQDESSASDNVSATSEPARPSTSGTAPPDAPVTVARDTAAPETVTPATATTEGASSGTAETSPATVATTTSTSTTLDTAATSSAPMSNRQIYATATQPSDLCNGATLVFGGQSSAVIVALCERADALEYVGLRLSDRAGIRLDACQEGEGIWRAYNYGWRYTVESDGNAPGSSVRLDSPNGSREFTYTFVDIDGAIAMQADQRCTN